MIRPFEVALVVVAEGSRIAVAYAIDPDGREVALSVSTALALDLRRALRLGARPIVEAEPWQILVGYPGRPHGPLSGSTDDVPAANHS